MCVKKATDLRSLPSRMVPRCKKTLAFSLLSLTFYLISIVHFFVPFTYSNGDYSSNSGQNRNNNNNKVLCVDSDLGVRAPLADGLVMKPYVHPSEWNHFDGSSEKITDQRIFFHETSSRSELSLKECCALESAAKHNPDKPIQLFVRPAKSCSYYSASAESLQRATLSSYYNPPWLEILSEYPNIEVILVNEEYYFAGSLLHDWYARGEWRQSEFETAHLSDYIRILTLSKRGGMYLDIDIIVMKPLQGNVFRNFLAYGDEGKNDISNGAMHLEHGHWLAGEMMSVMAKEYDPSSYIYNGPDVISDVMYRLCGLVTGNERSNSCRDVHLLPDKVFYPIPSIFSHTLFLESNRTDTETLKKIRQSYGLHLWHSISRHHDPLDVTSQHQLIAIIAREHCPATIARAAEFVLL